MSAGKALSSVVYTFRVWEYLWEHGPRTVASIAEEMNIKPTQARSAVATLQELGMAHNGDKLIKPDFPRRWTTAIETYKDRQAAELARIQRNLDIIPKTSFEDPGAGSRPSPRPWSPQGIKELRNALDLSQRAAAKEWGIPLGTLKAVETGNREPTEELVTKLEAVTSGYKAVTNAK